MPVASSLCVHVCFSEHCVCVFTRPLMMMKYVANVVGYFFRLTVVVEVVVFAWCVRACVKPVVRECMCVFNWTSLGQSPGDGTHLLFPWLRTTDGLVSQRYATHTHTHTHTHAHTHTHTTHTHTRTRTEYFYSHESSSNTLNTNILYKSCNQYVTHRVEIYLELQHRSMHQALMITRPQSSSPPSVSSSPSATNFCLTQHLFCPEITS